MALSPQEVQHVAELAKLHLSDEEITQFAEQLSQILDHAEVLQEIDTSAVPPTPYVLDLDNVMRADVPHSGLDKENVLKNAPDHSDGFFRVRAVFEE